MQPNEIDYKQNITEKQMEGCILHKNGNLKLIRIIKV